MGDAAKKYFIYAKQKKKEAADALKVNLSTDFNQLQKQNHHCTDIYISIHRTKCKFFFFFIHATDDLFRFKS